MAGRRSLALVVVQVNQEISTSVDTDLFGDAAPAGQLPAQRTRPAGTGLNDPELVCQVIGYATDTDGGYVMVGAGAGTIHLADQGDPADPAPRFEADVVAHLIDTGHLGLGPPRSGPGRDWMDLRRVTVLKKGRDLRHRWQALTPLHRSTTG